MSGTKGLGLSILALVLLGLGVYIFFSFAIEKRLHSARSRIYIRLKPGRARDSRLQSSK